MNSIDTLVTENPWLSATSATAGLGLGLYEGFKWKKINKDTRRNILYGPTIAGTIIGAGGANVIAATALGAAFGTLISFMGPENPKKEPQFVSTYPSAGALIGASVGIYSTGRDFLDSIIVGAGITTTSYILGYGIGKVAGIVHYEATHPTKIEVKPTELNNR